MRAEFKQGTFLIIFLPKTLKVFPMTMVSGYKIHGYDSHINHVILLSAIFFLHIRKIHFNLL